MLRRTAVTLAVIGTSIGLAISGCSGGSSATDSVAPAADAAASVMPVTGASATAAAEPGSGGDLSVFAWSGEIPDGVVTAFEAQTGINVTMDNFDNNETMISKLAAGGQYDIVEPSQYAVQQMIAQGLIQTLDASKVEGLDNLMPKFLNPSFDPNNAHSVAWVWGATGILYNEDCFDAPVTSWKTMFDPKYAGKLYMHDNMMAAYLAALQLNGDSANSRDQAQIEKATETLLAQKEILAGYNSSNYADLVSTGEACAAEAYSGTAAAKAVAANPKVHYVQPSEGGTVWVDSFAIGANAQNIDAAYKWINFTLQPEIAALLTDEASSATVNAAAKDFIKNKDLLGSPAVYLSDEAVANAEFLSDPGESMQFFQEGWTKVRGS